MVNFNGDKGIVFDWDLMRIFENEFEKIMLISKRINLLGIINWSKVNVLRNISRTRVNNQSLFQCVNA